jgi:hypothetical protein
MVTVAETCADTMVEILRTNDVVLLSFLTALFADSGIESVVLDAHTSVLEGSIGALPRRLMVAGRDEIRARALMKEANISDG